MKTIRLPKSIEKSLEREARSRNVSLNSFIVSVLSRHDSWDRLADKFGMMSVPSDEMVSILDALTEIQIQNTAKECGETIPRAMMQFWFSNVTPESFLRFLSLRMNFQHFVNNEVISGSEGGFVLTARHEHGKKWSIWSCNYIVEAIRANFGVEAKFEISGNTYRIESPPLTSKFVQKTQTY